MMTQSQQKDTISEITSTFYWRWLLHKC